MSYFSLTIFLLYLFSTSAAFFTRYINTKVGNFVAIILAFITFIIAASRPWYFPDVDTYFLMYEHAASGDFGNPLYWAAHGEPGFKIFTYYAYHAFDNFDIYLLVIALLSYTLLFSISKISSVPFAYLWFTYFSFYFVTRDLGTLRLSIASHLIVIFFLQRKIIWQVISLGIATTTFQIFSFIAIFAKMISRVKINLTSISILFFISYAFSGLLDFEGIKFLIPEDRANNYGGSNVVSAGGVSIAIPIIRNLFFACLIFYLLKDKTRDQFVRLLIWSAFLSAALYIMTSGILVVAQRFSAYFGAAVPLALAFLMNDNYFKNHQFLLVLAACFFNFLTLFFFNDFIWKVKEYPLELLQ